MECWLAAYLGKLARPRTSSQGGLIHMSHLPLPCVRKYVTRSPSMDHWLRLAAGWSSSMNHWLQSMAGKVLPWVNVCTWRSTEVLRWIGGGIQRSMKLQWIGCGTRRLTEVLRGIGCVVAFVARLEEVSDSRIGAHCKCANLIYDSMRYDAMHIDEDKGCCSGWGDEGMRKQEAWWRDSWRSMAGRDALHLPQDRQVHSTSPLKKCGLALMKTICSCLVVIILAV